MDPKHSYRVKAAQYRARAQTEHDAVLRAALEDLAMDYSRLAERPANETALTVEVDLLPEDMYPSRKH